MVFGVFWGFGGRRKRKALVVGSGVGAEEESVFSFFGRFASMGFGEWCCLDREVGGGGGGCWVSWEREKEGGEG